MSFTAKSLNIADFAYLNIYLQWLVPLTIIQSLGIPLLSNIYVSSNKISLEKYKKIFFSIIFKLSFLSIPLIYFTATKILNLSQEIILIYMMLMYVNLFLYFISQLLQSKKLIFESYLTSNYGQRGFILSFIPAVIIGAYYFLELSLDLKNILMFVLMGSIVALVFGLYFLKKKVKSDLPKNESIPIKELIIEGTKISLNVILNTSILPLIFTLSLYFFGEEITGRYQANTRLLLISFYFYQSIMVSILIPEIFNLFTNDKNMLLKRVKFILKRTLFYGLCIIVFFLSTNEIIITVFFNKNYLLSFNNFLMLSFILLIGLILNIGFPLLNYAKLNKEALVIRLSCMIIGFFILQLANLIYPQQINMNLIIIIFYVFPNLIAFSYWNFIIKKSLQ